ncbi:MAG: prolyl-tRNA synthetase associated domain-containing protein [Bacillota bacterium]|nr:prolyl-tRNA synthetase associated domain-containing protein [Bacillota bacterium]MDW7677407.1 prolyl-tRNA synthetase associated domain-containing protein [Bacillota bacterium]
MTSEKERAQKVIDVLNELGIQYTLHEHPAVYTVEEAQQHAEGIEGLQCKNLFLRDQKGKKHFLVVAENIKPVQVKEVGRKLGAGNLSFASPERLLKHLDLEPGAVSPFGLINDPENKVVLVLDQDLQKADLINFHPNDNTKTLTLRYEDFQKFVKWTGNTVKVLPL